MDTQLKHHKRLLFQVLFWLILALACALRFAALGEVPADIHQDEAMTGYEALALFLSGADSYGFVNPVYLTAWGSGTSVLYAWLLEICFKLWDVSIWSLRFPQAVISVLGCYVFYRLIRIFFDQKTALVGFFIISIMPWSVMSGRWGLDAHIAPTFGLLGFYFYCRALKRRPYLYLSVLFYALTMYAYAVYWGFLLICLPVFWGYFLWYHGKKVWKTAVLSMLLGGMLVCPLLLLVLVNYGVIGEIQLPYLSVSKLLAWRGGEIGFHDGMGKLKMLFHILVRQNDGWLSNMIPQYGLFYLFTPLLMLLGLWCMGLAMRQGSQQKRFSLAFLVLVQIVIGLGYAAMFYSFSNRVSFLFMPLMIAVVFGMTVLMRYKQLVYAVLLLYLGSFIGFAHTYFTRYNQMLAQSGYLYQFSYGIKEAIAAAQDLHAKSGAEIYFLEEPYLYAKVLFLGQVPPEAYRQSVRWYNYPDAFLQARSFLYYHFENSVDFNALPSGVIYVAHQNRQAYFADMPYKRFGNYIVAFDK